MAKSHQKKNIVPFAKLRVTKSSAEHENQAQEDRGLERHYDL